MQPHINGSITKRKERNDLARQRSRSNIIGMHRCKARRHTGSTHARSPRHAMRYSQVGLLRSRWPNYPWHLVHMSYTVTVGRWPWRSVEAANDENDALADHVRARRAAPGLHALSVVRVALTSRRLVMPAAALLVCPLVRQSVSAAQCAATHNERAVAAMSLATVHGVERGANRASGDAFSSRAIVPLNGGCRPRARDAARPGRSCDHAIGVGQLPQGAHA